MWSVDILKQRHPTSTEIMKQQNGNGERDMLIFKCMLVELSPDVYADLRSNQSRALLASLSSCQVG